MHKVWMTNSLNIQMLRTAKVSVFKAAIAEFNIGIASNRLASHSSFIIVAASACLLAAISSTRTTYNTWKKTTWEMVL